MDYVINALGTDSQREIKSVQIDYRKEVLSNERLEIFTKAEENEILAKGIDAEGNLKFLCQIEY